MSKLFDLSNEENIAVPELSTEEIYKNKLDILGLEQEIFNLDAATQIAKESVMSLESALAIAEKSLKNGNVTTSDVLNLNTIIASASNSVGLEAKNITLSSEDISDPVEALKLSIEEGHSVITKIIGAISKTFARYNNVVIKYLGKFDTFLTSLFTNLEKTRTTLIGLREDGYNLKGTKISDGSFMQWHGWRYMGALSVGNMEDPVKGLNEIYDIFKKPTFAKELLDSILSMVERGKDLKPIYGSDTALKLLEKNFSKKLKNFFCKSTKEDRIIIGAVFESVFVLEKCKPLHITSKAMPWNFSVLTLTMPSNDILGNPKTFTAPDINDMIKLCDNGLAAIKNRKKVVDEIHNLLKIGSETISKIDDAANWENLNIYGVLPMILLVFSKTYGELPNSINALGKVYIKEKDYNK